MPATIASLPASRQGSAARIVPRRLFGIRGQAVLRTLIRGESAVLRTKHLLRRGDSRDQPPRQQRIVARVEHATLAPESDLRTHYPRARLHANPGRTVTTLVEVRPSELRRMPT